MQSGAERGQPWALPGAVRQILGCHRDHRGTRATHSGQPVPQGLELGVGCEPVKHGHGQTLMNLALVRGDPHVHHPA